MPGIIVEGFPQLPNAPLQDVIRNKSVWPHLPDELLFGDWTTVGFAQANQDFHHLGLKASALPVALNAVQLRRN